MTKVIFLVVALMSSTPGAPNRVVFEPMPDIVTCQTAAAEAEKLVIEGVSLIGANCVEVELKPVGSLVHSN